MGKTGQKIKSQDSTGMHIFKFSNLTHQNLMVDVWLLSKGREKYFIHKLMNIIIIIYSFSHEQMNNQKWLNY